MVISTRTFHSPFPLPRSPREQGATEKSAHSQEETADQQAELEKLRHRDREVRTHEQVHLAAAGGLATGEATFTFQRGPDGKQCAVGEEVSIDSCQEILPPHFARPNKSGLRLKPQPIRHHKTGLS